MGRRKRRVPIATVIERHAADILQLPGVIGIGEGAIAEGPCITVLLKCDDSRLSDRLPSTLEGYPVRAQITGPLRAQKDFS